MLILCSERGRQLRADNGGRGAFGLVDFFDGRPGSDTHGKQVTRRPGCGPWLYYGFGIEPDEVAQPG